MGIGEDAAAQLADAGLIGAAFERGGGGPQDHDAKCGNCGADLTGRYCQVCGQLGHVHRSLLHLAEEFFHGMLHFDGKLWRTAPLLFFRPGALTRRYIEGQRVRFVSPIALFLFSIFLMFFAVATIDPTISAESFKPEERAELKAGLSEATHELDIAHGADEEEFSPFGFDWRDFSRKLSKDSRVNVFDNPVLSQKLRASLADPDLLLYKLRGAASEFSFLLVPLSLPVLWLMFLFRRGVHLYDHVIFALHSLSFMALFVSVCVVLGQLGLPPSSPLWGWLVLAVPVHMFFHLKGSYRLKTMGALWRTGLLGAAALVVLTCYAAAILLVSLMH